MLLKADKPETTPHKGESLNSTDTVEAFSYLETRIGYWAISSIVMYLSAEAASGL